MTAVHTVVTSGENDDGGFLWCNKVLLTLNDQTRPTL